MPCRSDGLRAAATTPLLHHNFPPIPNASEQHTRCMRQALAEWNQAHVWNGPFVPFGALTSEERSWVIARAQELVDQESGRRFATDGLPSAADLDRVAEQENILTATSSARGSLWRRFLRRVRGGHA